MIGDGCNQSIDADQLRLDPGAVFASPEALLDYQGLSRIQKVDMLRRWHYDAAEVAVAEEEGMPGHDSDLLRRILLALQKLAPIDPEHVSPNKQHGLPSSSIDPGGYNAAVATASVAVRHHSSERSDPWRPGLGRQLGLRQGDALIVVDVQRDFLPGGSLAIPGADDLIALLNAYIAAFDAQHLPIFLTRDWHPENHCSFQSAGGRWPAHCVQGTLGAQWPEGLDVAPGARIISKGTDRHAEAYSGFSGTTLLTLLQELKVRRLFVGGLATDYCVRATVLDAHAHGFDVVVLADAIRGVNAEPGDERRAVDEMVARGAWLFEPSHPPDASAHAERPEASLGASYGFGKPVTLPFTDAINRVTQALQSEGFGVLSDVDVAATLKKKPEADVPPYRILSACNPTLAYRALEAEPSIGLLLPCNVVVRQDSGGTVHVEFLDPNVVATLVGTPAVTQLASAVRLKLVRVMNSI